MISYSRWCKDNYDYAYLVVILHKFLHAQLFFSEQAVYAIADTFGILIQLCSMRMFHILHVSPC